jgi:hypothetical protein
LKLIPGYSHVQKLATAGPEAVAVRQAGSAAEAAPEATESAGPAVAAEAAAAAPVSENNQTDNLRKAE